MKIKRTEFFIAVCCLLIFGMLQISYCFIETNAYGYMGFETEFNASLFVGTNFLAIVLVAVACFNSRPPLIKNILTLLVVFFVFPSLIMFCYNPEYVWSLLASYLFLFFLFFFLSRYKLSFSGPIIDPIKQSWLLMLVFSSMLIPYFFLYGSSINLKNLLLVDIYETRQAHASIGNLYTGYTYSLLAKFLLPALIVVYLIRKNYMRAVLIMSMLIFLFFCGAHKAILFSFFLIFIFYFSPYRIKLRNLLLIILLLLSSAQIAFLMADNLFIEANVIQRTFFLNQLLDIFYLKEFGDEPLHWSNSFLKNFISYNHEAEPAYIIGEKYFKSPEMQANNGIVSDGLMNFGFIGMMINSVFFSVIFIYLASLRLSHRFFGLFFILIITFQNSPLSTALMTHGILLFLIFAQLVLKKSDR